MDKVDLSRVEKLFGKLSSFIVVKLQGWAQRVELYGLMEVRKIPGFHDEPLKGQRQGQRLIRLSRGYRAIYEVTEAGAVRIIIVMEVSKHEY